MRTLSVFMLLPVLACAAQNPSPAPAPSGDGLTMAEVLENAGPSDWRALDPNNTLYMTLASGVVVIELAPSFAPKHVANIRALVKQGYFDGLAIVRSQENYVVQWGDPKAGEEGARDFGDAAKNVSGEYHRDATALPFTKIDAEDAYADEVGFVEGMPAARDGAQGRAWLTHCYAMVGAGRDMGADSGSGAELYVVIGHSPRHLDRNVTLVGRVVQGMEFLSTLARGTGPLGFYEDAQEKPSVERIRLGADMPESERAAVEILRTDTQTFQKLVDARRYRREEWFIDAVGRVGLCNVPLPVRSVKNSE